MWNCCSYIFANSHSLQGVFESVVWHPASLGGLYILIFNNRLDENHRSLDQWFPFVSLIIKWVESHLCFLSGELPFHVPGSFFFFCWDIGLLICKILMYKEISPLWVIKVLSYIFLFLICLLIFMGFFFYMQKIPIFVQLNVSFLL